MSMAEYDIADFVYVDTAIGGVNKRNNVKRLDQVRACILSDCYVSHNRATIELLTWRNSHKNENGKPTVAGFDGPTWAPDLHLDYDNEADPGQALIWLRQGLDRFEAYGVDLRALGVYFSGHKGFGVEIPHSLFGGFVPDTDFHRRLGRAAKRIMGKTPFDRSVYDRLRLWRRENSRHSKSHLYKIRLTITEARTLTIDQIRALAAGPRDTSTIPELTPIADDEWLPVDELVAIWEATASPDVDEDSDAFDHRAPSDEARDRLTISTIAASWPKGGRNEVEGSSANTTVSRHSDFLMPIIGFLAGLTSAEHAGEIAAAAAEAAGDQTFLHGRDWRGEIKRIVESTAARKKSGEGEPVRGLPWLKKEFPGLGRVLEALWPAPRIKFSDDEDETAHNAGPDATPDMADVPGDAILDEVHAFLGRFVAYPSTAAHVAHTLWVAHTHLMDAWESTPRIAFLSPEPGSGKTRALEVSELLVPLPVEAINVTPAYLFRKVGDEKGRPTVLYDEIDTVFGPRAKENEEIRGLLNAGHRRGAVAGRCVVKGKTVETEEIPAYCAVALAGLGWLPETILSRAIVARMRRRAPGEHIEPYRRRVHAPEGHPIRDRLATWARTMEASLSNAWPVMPEGIVDRDSDVWEPLLAVADAAGGDWPTRARCSAVALVAASRESVPSLGVRLLSDLRTVFGEKSAMATDNILAALNALEEAPWGEILKGKPLNALALAQRLRQYGVSSKNVREGERVVKGYTADDLADAWSRYLPPSSDRAATSATDGTPPSGQGVADGADHAATDDSEPATDAEAPATDDDVDLCATCGANPVDLLGLDCDECMGADR
jgi:hypothetical protein